MEPNAQNPYPGQDASNLDPIMQLLLKKYAENQGINWMQRNPHRDAGWTAAEVERDILQPSQQGFMPQVDPARIDFMNKFMSPAVIANENKLQNRYRAQNQILQQRLPGQTQLQ